jgi:hypothetical protein
MKKQILDKDVRLRIGSSLAEKIERISKMNALKPATFSRMVLNNHVEEYITKNYLEK